MQDSASVDSFFCPGGHEQNVGVEQGKKREALSLGVGGLGQKEGGEQNNLFGGPSVQRAEQGSGEEVGEAGIRRLSTK